MLISISEIAVAATSQREGPLALVANYKFHKVPKRKVFLPQKAMLYKCAIPNRSSRDKRKER